MSLGKFSSCRRLDWPCWFWSVGTMLGWVGQRSASIANRLQWKIAEWYHPCLVEGCFFAENGEPLKNHDPEWISAYFLFFDLNSHEILHDQYKLFKSFMFRLRFRWMSSTDFHFDSKSVIVLTHKPWYWFYLYLPHTYNYFDVTFFLVNIWSIFKMSRGFARLNQKNAPVILFYRRRCSQSS